jgi:hypothetical protein
MQLEGKGMAKNPDAAAKTLLKAAELLSEEAMCQLGKMSLSGEGMAKSIRNAKKWFLKAAARGSEEAKAILASDALDV